MNESKDNSQRFSASVVSAPLNFAVLMNPERVRGCGISDSGCAIISGSAGLKMFVKVLPIPECRPNEIQIPESVRIAIGSFSGDLIAVEPFSGVTYATAIQIEPLFDNNGVDFCASVNDFLSTDSHPVAMGSVCLLVIDGIERAFRVKNCLPGDRAIASRATKVYQSDPAPPFRVARQLMHFFSEVYVSDFCRNQIEKFVRLPLERGDFVSNCQCTTNNAVLVHGPSGCGKSAVLSAIESLVDVPSVFVEMKRLIKMPHEEVMEKIRRIFGFAEDKKASILIFDDINVIMENAKQVPQKKLVVLFTFLLDKALESPSTLVVASARSKYDMTPELMRYGRFGHCIDLSRLSDNGIEEILKRHTFGYKIQSVDVVKRACEAMEARAIASLCRTAIQNLMKENRCKETDLGIVSSMKYELLPKHFGCSERRESDHSSPRNSPRKPSKKAQRISTAEEPPQKPPQEPVKEEPVQQKREMPVYIDNVENPFGTVQPIQKEPVVANEPPKKVSPFQQYSNAAGGIAVDDSDDDGTLYHARKSSHHVPFGAPQVAVPVEALDKPRAARKDPDNPFGDAPDEPTFNPFSGNGPAHQRSMFTDKPSGVAAPQKAPLQKSNDPFSGVGFASQKYDPFAQKGGDSGNRRAQEAARNDEEDFSYNPFGAASEAPPSKQPFGGGSAFDSRSSFGNAQSQRGLAVEQDDGFNPRQRAPFGAPNTRPAQRPFAEENSFQPRAPFGSSESRNQPFSNEGSHAPSGGPSQSRAPFASLNQDEQDEYNPFGAANQSRSGANSRRQFQGEQEEYNPFGASNQSGRRGDSRRQFQDEQDEYNPFGGSNQSRGGANSRRQFQDEPDEYNPFGAANQSRGGHSRRQFQDEQEEYNPFGSGQTRGAGSRAQFPTEEDSYNRAQPFASDSQGGRFGSDYSGDRNSRQRTNPFGSEAPRNNPFSAGAAVAKPGARLATYEDDTRPSPRGQPLAFGQDQRSRTSPFQQSFNQPQQNQGYTDDLLDF